ncbi:M48 family metallopeptidase, partial [Guyparkeria sp.]|uniref:M48 family metallopeptidase n=1 Tax=Guyparkeria sp. TaxID=2035736 RepID=UPI0039706E89
MKSRIEHPLGEIEVTRKRIRNLYLRLGETPDTLRVSAPSRFGDAEIHAFVSARSGWVRRQREKMNRRPPGFDTGALPDLFHLLGRPHALETAHDPDLHPGKATVSTEGDRLVITSREGDGTSARSALRNHCRDLLSRTMHDRVPFWAERMALPVPEYRIRRMKTRWGTCNIRDRRIW